MDCNIKDLERRLDSGDVTARTPLAFAYDKAGRYEDADNLFVVDAKEHINAIVKPIKDYINTVASCLNPFPTITCTQSNESGTESTRVDIPLIRLFHTLEDDYKIFFNTDNFYRILRRSGSEYPEWDRKSTDPALYLTLGDEAVKKIRSIYWYQRKGEHFRESF